MPKLFARKFLQDSSLMLIRCDPGKCQTGARHEDFGCPGEMDLSFNRFDTRNRHRCIFTETAETVQCRNSYSADPQETYVNYSAWKHEVERYAHRTRIQIDVPPFLIRIGDEVNDTELSGLHFDLSTREMSFDWETTFANFYRELAELDRRTQNDNDLAESVGRDCNRERRNIRRARIEQQRVQFGRTFDQQFGWPAADCDTEEEAWSYRSMRDWKDKLKLEWNANDVAADELDSWLTLPSID